MGRISGSRLSDSVTVSEVSRSSGGNSSERRCAVRLAGLFGGAGEEDPHRRGGGQDGPIRAGGRAEPREDIASLDAPIEVEFGEVPADHFRGARITVHER